MLDRGGDAPSVGLGPDPDFQLVVRAASEEAFGALPASQGSTLIRRYSLHINNKYEPMPPRNASQPHPRTAGRVHHI